jgi:hypothetical protein
MDNCCVGHSKKTLDPPHKYVVYYCDGAHTPRFVWRQHEKDCPHTT